MLGDNLNTENPCGRQVLFHENAISAINRGLNRRFMRSFWRGSLQGAKEWRSYRPHNLSSIHCVR